MRNLFISILILFLLAACGTSAPQASEVSATQTPSPTLPPTLTPTASVTPTPAVPAEYMEVYKHLDSSFALETGTANAEGMREIMTTNAYGLREVVATINGNGAVVMSDILKYTPIDGVEVKPEQVMDNLLPLSKVMNEGLAVRISLLNHPELPAPDDSIGRMDVIRVDDMMMANGEPQKVQYRLLDRYYAINEETGDIHPVATYIWYNLDEAGNVIGDPVVYVNVYKRRISHNQLPEISWAPLGFLDKSRVYTDDRGKPTDVTNPLTVLASDAEMNNSVLSIFEQEEFLPQMTPNGRYLIFAGRSFTQ